MQKIATIIFICASVVFGILGLTMVIWGPDQAPRIFERLIMGDVFIILPSFALSVASKYLSK